MRAAVRIALVLALVGASGAALARTPPPAQADRRPQELEGADVEEKLGAKIPLELEFRDEQGQPIELGELVAEDQPVILTFNYSSCPMLCSVQLGGLTDALTKMEWQAGRQFRILTIGLDPDEEPERTRATKERYLQRYDAPEARLGWRFLAGPRESVKALAEAVGYGYRYHADKDQYAHPAVAVVVSPEGEVASYLYGVSYDPKEVREILASASRGEQTESDESFILACYHWVRDEGAPAVANMIMNYGAGLFAVLFLTVFGVFLVRMRRKEMSEMSSDSKTAKGGSES